MPFKFQKSFPRPPKTDRSKTIITIAGWLLIICIACSGLSLIGSTLSKLFSPAEATIPTPLQTAKGLVTTSTPSARTIVIPSATIPVSTAASEPTTATASEPTATTALEPTAAPPAAACPPANPSQTGTVLDIVDGVTLKVMIDGATYTVKYIGLQAPAPGQYYAAEAKQKNAKLTYAQKVTLIPRAVNKDPNGALLRYVLLDDLLVNTELLEQGYISVDPNFAEPECLSAYNAAQQTAKTASAGQWGAPPTAVIPPHPKCSRHIPNITLIRSTSPNLATPIQRNRHLQ